MSKRSDSKSRSSADRSSAGWLARLLAPLDLRRLHRRVGRLESLLGDLERQRLPSIEEDQTEALQGLTATHDEIERLRDQSLPQRWDLDDQRYDRIEERLEQRSSAAEVRLDKVEQGIRDSNQERESALATLSASSQRCQGLIDRLSSELSGLAELVERILVDRPLPVPEMPECAPQSESELAAVQPLLVDSFRGSEAEILERLDHYPELLYRHTPVLDLGSGRGELLGLLGESGISATGVEADPALAGAAVRRGLSIIEADVLVALRRQAPESWGAVTAVHLMEHLPPAVLLQVLAEIRRVLKPGGALVVECPNPHTLRVGAGLYWLDPTHQRPLLPETLELFLKASGFTVAPLQLLHPFPDDQRLTVEANPLPEGAPPELYRLQQQLDQLRQQLDHLIYGPRDFLLVASKPSQD
jgi:O-antigen chain-terminating methyltransferase